MKKLVIIILAITTIFYAASSIAAPPFRLKGAKFILKQDVSYISNNGDSLIRERIYFTKITRYDSAFENKQFIGMRPVEKQIPVVVRFTVSLKDLNLCGKTMEQITRDRLGRVVTIPGIKNRPSYVPDNHISELLLKQHVMVSFLGEDFTYTKYVSGKAYKVIFEGDK